MVTNNGTAAFETGLCKCHFGTHKQVIERQARNDVRPNSWTDVSENEVIECQVCGAK